MDSDTLMRIEDDSIRNFGLITFSDILVGATRDDFVRLLKTYKTDNQRMYAIKALIKSNRRPVCPRFTL